MKSFKKWITNKLGYEPRQIDLANELGESRGELVGKWFRGVAYPNKDSCKRLADYLHMQENDVLKAVLQMRIDDIEG